MKGQVWQFLPKSRTGVGIAVPTLSDGSGTSWRSVAPFLLVDSAKRKNSVKVNLGFIINVFFLIVRFVERPFNILKIRRSGIVSEVIQNRFE